MRMRTFLLTILFLVTTLITENLHSQGVFAATSQDETDPGTSDSLLVKPFPVTGISDEFSRSNLMINESGKKQVSEERIEGFITETDTLFSQIDAFLGDSITLSLEGSSSRELDQMSKRAQFFMDRIEGIQLRLSRVAGELEGESVLLRDIGKRWQLTLEQGAEDQALEPRVARISRTIQEIDSVRNLLQADLVFVVENQDRLTEKSMALENLLARVKEQKIVLGETMFQRDAPGFHKDLAGLRNSNLVRSHLDEFWKSIEEDLEILKSGYLRAMILATLFTMAFLAFFIWFKKNHRQLIAGEYAELTALHCSILNVPIASTLFLMSLLIRFLIPDLPQAFYFVNLLILMITMAILVIRIYGPQFRVWVLVLVLVTSLSFLYELSYHPGVMIRIILLGLCLAGIWLFYWVHRRKPYSGKMKHKLIYNAFNVLIVVFIGMEFLALIFNLVGMVRLAEFLTLLPYQITILAIAIQLSTKLADTILYLILSSKYVQKLNVVREEFQVIHRKSLWVVDFILLIIFLSITLSVLRIKALVYEWGRGFLTDGFNIGEVEISLRSILIFVFVIWLSIMITRIISHILEKDVFTRVSTAKGVPGTVILLLKIALISGGFFLAAAASGMQLTNLSIVLGAFSVGIGFGLQNIFNNMVSGLILAFERPINVGDVVQVGELLGTVRSIGLRSSRVLSFDGAEVIVPNGNLISNEMINWTLSDSNRRMDIRVGVAYGTNPEVVLELMGQIAAEHPQVRKKPAPKAYFIEFGDSSLNFRLLAWVHLDNRLAVESELNVLINQKLAEAGIEIPFPQTDLHIRSDATKAVSAPGKVKK